MKYLIGVDIGTSGTKSVLFDTDGNVIASAMYESPDVTGYITDEASELTGLKSGIPVCGGAGDNAAAAIGTGVCCDGKSFVTIGTSGVVFAHTDEAIIDKKGRVHTFCCAVPGAWHVMGVTQAAGLSLNWFKNNLAQEMSYKEIDKASAEVPIGAGNLIYLPYLMGERTPVLDADARGVFFGLSAIHTKAHMARAVMEGVSYSLRDCLEVLIEMGIETTDMAACGGGAKSEFWRSMIADTMNIPIKTMQSDEGPALGVAILAGVGAGIYKTVEEGCNRVVRAKSVTAVSNDNHKKYMKYYGVYKTLYPSLKDTYKALKKADS